MFWQQGAIIMYQQCKYEYKSPCLLYVTVTNTLLYRLSFTNFLCCFFIYIFFKH